MMILLIMMMMMVVVVIKVVNGEMERLFPPLLLRSWEEQQT